MDEYGTFLDKGVKGANPSLVDNKKQVKKEYKKGAIVHIVIRIKDHQCNL